MRWGWKVAIACGALLAVGGVADEIGWHNIGGGLACVSWLTAVIGLLCGPFGHWLLTPYRGTRQESTAVAVLTETRAQVTVIPEQFLVYCRCAVNGRSFVTTFARAGSRDRFRITGIDITGRLDAEAQTGLHWLGWMEDVDLGGWHCPHCGDPGLYVECDRCGHICRGLSPAGFAKCGCGSFNLNVPGRTIAGRGYRRGSVAGSVRQGIVIRKAGR